MKKSILLTSLGAALIATGFGVTAVILQGHPSTDEAAVQALVTMARLYQLAGLSGLFSIASFFVGLAYPQVQVNTSSFDQETQTQISKTING